MQLTNEMKAKIRIPYALRHVPGAAFVNLLRIPSVPAIGAVALAEVKEIGKNTALELDNGRRCSLHTGDLLAVAFGNRYATMQFEGYARVQDEQCDLLSMGGLCGIVESKHDRVSGPTTLRILGALGGRDQRPLSSVDFALPPVTSHGRIRVAVVCGTSMDAGKTHTVMCTIQGLRNQGYRVAGVKLTGSATGRDTWSMLDAGACVALDFTDGGFPSTYLCTREQLLHLYHLLVGHARERGAEWVVVEIADGLLQVETAALLNSPQFRSTVDHFLFAAGEPMAAVGGVGMLRQWGIEPLAVSGVVSMSPLNIREVEAAVKLRCLTARELQNGALASLMKRAATMSAPAVHHPKQVVSVCEA
jgi:hypothetical protein